MRYEGARAAPAVIANAGGGTRLGRLAATRPGRALRDGLAAHGLLWALVAARQQPTRGSRSSGAVERMMARIGFPGRIRERLAGRHSDVCIDGFPRSANTYTVLAFRQWNPGVRIAHHMHAVFQIRRAVRLGVPCCVLVRKPIHAVASTLIMDRQRVSEDACIRSYVRFHSRIAPLRDRFVVCRFEELVEDPAVAVKRLNERFGTAFRSLPMTEEAEAATLAELRQRRRPREGLPEFLMPVPNEAKEGTKEELRERLARHPLIPAADRAYAAVLEASES